MTKKIGIDWAKGYLTEREIYLIKNRKNRGEIIDLKPLYDSLDNGDNMGFKLELCQVNKGFKWLMNLYVSPTGKIRSSNPYGYREIAVLKSFKDIRIIDYYDSGNQFVKFYVPYYRVIGGYGTFDYCVYGGIIHILG